jgi:hypothetical protein
VKKEVACKPAAATVVLQRDRRRSKSSIVIWTVVKYEFMNIFTARILFGK